MVGLQTEWRSLGVEGTAPCSVGDPSQSLHTPVGAIDLEDQGIRLCSLLGRKIAHEDVYILIPGTSDPAL